MRARRVVGWAVFSFCVVVAAIGCDASESAPGSGGAVASGGDCLAGQMVCGATCTDSMTDPLNCGMCGVACQTRQLCQAGRCVCQSGLVDCGAGNCVDTRSNGTHCGSCGVECTGGTVCAAGACEAACPDGTTRCGSGCSTLANDVFNCGACGVHCPSSHTCEHGQCSRGDAGTGGTGAGGQTTGGGSASGGSPSGGSASGGSPSGGSASGGSTGGSEGNDRCDVGVWDGVTEPQPLSLSGNTFAHDPTMIEADGVFYRFWTGDNIPSASSTDLRSWSDAPAAINGGYSPWVADWLGGIPGNTFNFPWAPDASFFGGQYHLYSSFSAIFGDNQSCITHLTTDSPAAGSWVDQGPVICTAGSEGYNAIDADVGVSVEGEPYLAFGSFWDGIMAFPLNSDGSAPASPALTRLAWARQIEAPVLFRRCGYYYLFVTWGICCPGEGRSVDDLTYRVAVGRSENILGPYLDRNGTPMLDGGGTLLVEGDGVTWAAAGHSDVIATGSKIYHFYHAYRQSNGAAEFRIVELPFDDAGWPVPGGP